MKVKSHYIFIKSERPEDNLGSWWVSQARWVHILGASGTCPKILSLSNIPKHLVPQMSQQEFLRDEPLGPGDRHVKESRWAK